MNRDKRDKYQAQRGDSGRLEIRRYVDRAGKKMLASDFDAVAIESRRDEISKARRPDEECHIGCLAGSRR